MAHYTREQKAFYAWARDTCLSAVDALQTYPSRLRQSEALTVWAIAYDCEPWVVEALYDYIDAAVHHGQEVENRQLILELREQVLNASDKQVAAYATEGEI